MAGLALRLAAGIGASMAVAAHGESGDRISAWDVCQAVAAPEEEAQLPADVQRCCAVRRQWLEIEAAGGCGDVGESDAGASSTQPYDCPAAEQLCFECRGGNEAAEVAATTAAAESSGGVGWNWTQLGPVAMTATDASDVSALDPAGRIQLSCALPRGGPPEHPCAMEGYAAVVGTDVGLGIVLIAGLVLLIVSVACAVLFERSLLPMLVRHSQRPLQTHAPRARGAAALRAAIAEAKAGALEAEASAAVAEGSAQDDCARCGNAQVLVIGGGGPSPPPPLLDVGAAPPPSPGSSPPPWRRSGSAREGGGLQALRVAAAADIDCASPAKMAAAEPPKTPTSGSWRPGTSCSVHSDSSRRPFSACSSPTESSRSGRARWPPRLARVWAFRLVFLRVAGLAALARTADAIFRVVLASGVGLPAESRVARAQRPPLELALVALATATPELLLCIPPLIWCARASRPPRRSVAGVPTYAAYIWRIPRFTFLASLIVAVELYSTTMAALAVASAPCDAPPWRVIAPYCVGVVVAVARGYSALLALRLQDDITGACRRVLPGVMVDIDGDTCAGAERGFSSLDALEAGEVASPVGTPTSTPTAAELARDLGQAEAAVDGWATAADLRISPGCGPKPVRSGWGEPTKVPPKSPKRPPAPPRGTRGWRCTGRSDSEFVASIEGEGFKKVRPAGKKDGRRCRRCCNRRFALRLSVLLVVLSATATAIIVRMTQSQPSASPTLPSSCVTAQNGTATCSRFELVGHGLWDSELGDFLADTMDTIEDCCRGCDALDGCQGWMFEGAGKRCRWIRFTEDPCVNNPGDLRCRCLTHPGMTFGFRPTTSRIIWVTPGSGSGADAGR